MKAWVTRDEAIMLGINSAGMAGLGLLMGVQAHGFWGHVGAAAWYAACNFGSVALGRWRGFGAGAKK